MDFIEKLFHICPDGGSWTLELALLLAPVLGVAALRLWRARRERRRLGVSSPV
jgi:hypothetical protein